MPSLDVECWPLSAGSIQIQSLWECRASLTELRCGTVREACSESSSAKLSRPVQCLYSAFPYPILVCQLFYGLKDGSAIALSSINRLCAFPNTAQHEDNAN